MSQTHPLPTISMYTPTELRIAGIAYNGVCLLGFSGALLAMAAMTFSLPAFVLIGALFGISAVILLLALLPDPASAPPGSWSKLQKLAAASDDARSTLAVWANTGNQLTCADVRRFKRYSKRLAAYVAYQRELDDDEAARGNVARGRSTKARPHDLP